MDFKGEPYAKINKTKNSEGSTPNSILDMVLRDWGGSRISVATL